MADEFVLFPEEETQSTQDPNSGNFNISGQGSFGSLSISGISTLGVTTITNLTAQKLDVYGNTNITGITNATTFSGQVNAGIGTITSLTGTRLSFSGISTFSSGPVLIGAGSSTGTVSQALQVTGSSYISGNLGIGATNPGAKLQIDGNVRVGSSNTSNEIRFYGIVGDNPGGYNHTAIIERKWGLDDESELLIFKGNDPDTATIHDRMRIVACGRIVFHSYNAFADVDTYIGAAGTSNINGSGYFNGNNLTVTGTVTQNSDESLKNNIRTISDGLEKVLKLRGVEFNRKDEEESIQHIGLIAQEVEKIIPEVVTKDMDGLKSVAYGNLVAVLVESIKELNQKVDRLTSIIESSTISR